MDIPVCFTQSFVDKQNVRSYGNIFNVTLLKGKNHAQFLKSILQNQDQTLVSQLTPGIKQALYTLRINLKNVSKDDFKSLFSSDPNNFMTPLDKTKIMDQCWTALSKIIPKMLFGSRHNENVFKNLIKEIVYGMKWQHIVLRKYISKWKYNLPLWNSSTDKESGMILYLIVCWIIQNVLSPMICLNFHVTTCKLDGDENKLHYFCKNEWQCFYDKSIQKMVRKGVIKKVEPYSIGRKIKKKHDLVTRLKLKKLKRVIPKLHLVLKANNDFRPIIRSKNDTQTVLEKQTIKRRLSFLRLLIGECQPKMEILFSHLYMKWKQLSQPKLYFIKSDLSNAFGCVDKAELLKILNGRFLQYCSNEKNIRILERNTKLYKEIFNDVRKHFLIRAGSTVYVWKKGLVQGYKYSPALSELYYKHLDEINFAEHIKNTKDDEIKLFTRVVDDYLYVTDSLTDAENFLKALKKYENVNYEKTVVNFPHPGIKFSTEITFLGYSYRTVDMEVSRAQNIFTGQMCYKISFNSTIANLYKFLETRIGQSSMQVNGLIFNFLYNKESLVWEHVFTTFCLSANKFCTILALLCDADGMAKFVQLYKRKVTVKLGNTILETLMRHKPDEFLFLYCINHFRYLSLLALGICAKKTPKCAKIVPLINDELAKSNCIFGKWKEHASRIDSNGNKLRMATKDICRRTDLRAIMRKFESLPDMFQCYNQKLI